MKLETVSNADPLQNRQHAVLTPNSEKEGEDWEGRSIET